MPWIPYIRGFPLQNFLLLEENFLADIFHRLKLLP